MKVLMINGSPHENGNTSLAVAEMEEIFRAEGVDVEILQVGNMAIRGCTGCYACSKLGKCAFDDIVNEAAEKFAESDGIVLASPVYYAAPNGTLVSFLDRLFYSSASSDKTMKVGASVAVARRGGCSTTFDALNKYLAISGMAIATSQYWNSVHGKAPGDAKGDGEGLQTMRTLARNMVFLMKSIALGKEQLGFPAKEDKISTGFIR